MENKSLPYGVSSPVIETSLKIGQWDKSKYPKTTDLEVEFELLPQDSQFRQHKQEKGNDREEIIGCYFQNPQCWGINP